MGKAVILGTGDSIIAKLAGAVATTQPTWNSGWVDTTGDTTAGGKGSLNGASEVTLVAAPGANQRQVDFCRVYNEDTAAAVLTVQVANGASRYTLGKWTLAVGAAVDVIDPANMVAGTNYEVPLTFSGSWISRVVNDVSVIGFDNLPDWTAGEAVSGWLTKTQPYINARIAMGGTAVQVAKIVHGATAVAIAYIGGVLSPNGRIYLVPLYQATATVWHYIDTATGSVVAYTHGATAVASAYIGGVLSPNGRIYLVPLNQATSTVWHYIDTATGSVVAYTHGATVVASAYTGGVLSPNGRIYLVPFTQATATVWHYIDTNCNGNWHKNLCTNPMFNKL